MTIDFSKVRGYCDWLLGDLEASLWQVACLVAEDSWAQPWQQ